MQTHERRLLDEWMANWSDLVDFEVYAVITPEEAGKKVAARMRSSFGPETSWLQEERRRISTRGSCKIPNGAKPSFGSPVVCRKLGSWHSPVLPPQIDDFPVRRPRVARANRDFRARAMFFTLKENPLNAFRSPFQPIQVLYPCRSRLGKH
jgi:hypothetical protein